jgi:hypothetical protein
MAPLSKNPVGCHRLVRDEEAVTTFLVPRNRACFILKHDRTNHHTVGITVMTIVCRYGRVLPHFSTPRVC